ncbi:hypothetical protein DMR21_03915 [Klebsiella variicola]|nr:hypothetical protein DMR21_03915 [Klebsiella variicola]
MLPADPAGLFLPPQGTFFQQGKRRRTGTKVTAGGWAHQEMLCLLRADPAGFFFAPAGASFLSARQAPQDRDKSDSGGLGASGNVELAPRRPRGLFFVPAGGILSFSKASAAGQGQK